MDYLKSLPLCGQEARNRPCSVILGRIRHHEELKEEIVEISLPRLAATINSADEAERTANDADANTSAGDVEASDDAMTVDDAAMALDDAGTRIGETKNGKIRNEI